MIHLNQPRRDSGQIHYCPWHILNPSVCLCHLHPSACSAFENVTSYHTTNTRHPLIWICFSQIWTWVCCSFSFLYSSIFLSFRHLGNSLTSQPHPMTSNAPFRSEEHPPHYQTSRFMSHKNYLLPSQTITGL